MPTMDMQPLHHLRTGMWAATQQGYAQAAETLCDHPQVASSLVQEEKVPTRGSVEADSTMTFSKGNWVCKVEKGAGQHSMYGWRCWTLQFVQLFQ